MKKLNDNDKIGAFHVDELRAALNRLITYGEGREVKRPKDAECMNLGEGVVYWFDTDCEWYSLEGFSDVASCNARHVEIEANRERAEADAFDGVRR